MSRRNPRFRRVNPTLPLHTGNVFQLSILGTIESQLTINNFYYMDNNEALTATTEANLVSVWRTAVNNVKTPFLAFISSDWLLAGYRVQVITTPTRIAYLQTETAGTAGTAPAGHEPTLVAGVISKYSLVRGQSGRGRIYLPGVPTANVTASFLTATGLALLQTLSTAITNSLVGADRTFVPQIVSRRGVAPGASNYGTSPITSATARVLLGTTRRRRIGRGK